MLHLVKLIERRFPQRHRAIVALLALLSAGALVLGIGRLIQG